MRKDKEKAILLRKQGKSYKQIREELGIATSTLAGWFKNEPWSQEIKKRLSLEISWSNPKALELLVVANKERWRIKHNEYRSAAIRELNDIKTIPFFLQELCYIGAKEKSSQDRALSVSAIANRR